MDSIPIGIREDTTTHEPFYIQDRRRHLVCWGQTGVGKSTLLQNIADYNIREGQGVTVIDPHGSIVENLLKRIPKNRTKDVIYINPQLTQVVGINIFEGVGRDDQKVSSIVDSFAKIFKDAWGFQSEQLLRWGCYAMLEQPRPATFITLKRFYSDQEFRRRCLKHVRNPSVLLFFSEYDSKAWDKLRAERTAPLLNKIDQFVTNSLVRSVIGQKGASFDFRQMIDRGQILLCNLSEGGIGKQEAAMLGGFIFSKIFFAGLSRQDVQEKDRRLHTIIIDEFQNFINAPIDYVLAESRKYALSLNLGTQIASALPVHIRESIFGNAGTNAVYRVGGVDAEILIKELSTNKPSYLLQDLADYRAYVRTLAYDPRKDAMRPVGPFLVRMYPPSIRQGNEQKKEVVISQSLKWFGKPRDMILRKIDEELRL
nr:putative type IV secretory pathway VirD4 component protein [uncultured bacterium]